MLFHASIGARDPARVAAVLAEIWQGHAYPYPSYPGAFLVTSGDGRGSGLEIYPAGQVLVPGKAKVEAEKLEDSDRPSETHLAIGVPLDEAELHRIAAREWWISRTCERAGAYRVVEFWIENRVLIEALTPHMQQEYFAFTAQRNWEVQLRSMGIRANDRPRHLRPARLPAVAAR